MRTATLTVLIAFFISCTTYAQEIDSLQIKINEIEQSLIYQTGVVELEEGNAKLTVPDGFRYLDKQQSIYVTSELWNNPVDSAVLGMLVPSNRGVLDDKGWAFVITYADIGYVKDDDAADINYDDLLKEMKEDVDATNTERVKLGFEKVNLIGWAATPFYDKQLSTLHWAKEVKFGESPSNTLNYNLRILGRKGMYNLNAVASMGEMSEVKTNIDKIIRCLEFNEGNKYSDFRVDTDNVAAWTIGGLVAGKVLAKVGFFALIAKFWKLIALACVSMGAGLLKYFKRRKGENETQITTTSTE